jgi:hypothetical protein
MLNIMIDNDKLCEAAQLLGHHKNMQETVEKALGLYVDYLQRINAQNQSIDNSDFFSLAGLWKDRNITPDSLRQQAWLTKSALSQVIDISG